jgi:hypothetical protein
MPSYLTKGEIEASKQRLPYACLSKEASKERVLLLRSLAALKGTTRTSYNINSLALDFISRTAAHQVQ